MQRQVCRRDRAPRRARHAQMKAAFAADNLPPAPLPAAAHLSSDTVSAATDGQAMLTVDAPGRLFIRAESKTGVALELVDMITARLARATDALMPCSTRGPTRSALLGPKGRAATRT